MFFWIHSQKLGDIWFDVRHFKLCLEFQLEISSNFEQLRAAKIMKFHKNRKISYVLSVKICVNSISVYHLIFLCWTEMATEW